MTLFVMKMFILDKECPYSLDNDAVAPRVGAWIEIDLIYLSAVSAHVAPRVGAWIEIMYHTRLHSSDNGRAPRGRVD